MIQDLLVGNCQYSDRILPAYSTDRLIGYASQLLVQERPPELRKTERAMEQFYIHKAVSFMRAHPWRTLRQKALNILYLFAPRIVPFYQGGRAVYLDGGIRVEAVVRRPWIHEFSYIIFYNVTAVLAATGLYLRRKQWRQDLILYLIVAGFLVVCSLFWPATRLRAPMDFVLLFYAACAMEKFLSYQSDNVRF